MSSSALPAALIAAYRESVYRVLEPAISLRIGLRSAALDALLDAQGVRDAAVITAWNPYGEVLPAAENEARQSALMAELTAARLPFLPAVGKGTDWSEPSLLVLGAGRPRCIALGRAHRQNAIVHCERGQPAELVLLR